VIKVSEYLEDYLPILPKNSKTKSDPNKDFSEFDSANTEELL